MRKKIEKLYNKLNVYERNVFGCFFDIHGLERKGIFGRIIEYANAGGSYVYCKWERYKGKNIYFKYLEVPITTGCTLNCKECNNLIQFYQKPSNFDADQVIRDIRRLCSVSKRIRMLRILGGEPLVHPRSAYILEKLDQIEEIKEVQIVTNGTLLFNRECLRVLQHEKFSVDISNYGIYSSRYGELINQLKRKGIRYHTQREKKPWKALSCSACRNRSVEEQLRAFSVCREDCHSLLNGELHICARSAHGTDLSLIEKRNGDFVSVRNVSGKKELKDKVYELLNKKLIAACNYCDMFRLEEMKTIPSAEQITKNEGQIIMNQWKEE